MWIYFSSGCKSTVLVCLREKGKKLKPNSDLLLQKQSLRVLLFAGQIILKIIITVDQMYLNDHSFNLHNPSFRLFMMIKYCYKEI